jgi:hypothetical protein
VRPPRRTSVPRAATSAAAGFIRVKEGRVLQPRERTSPYQWSMAFDLLVHSHDTRRSLLGK